MSDLHRNDIDRILAEQSAELLEAMKRNEAGSSERLAAWLAESRRHVRHYLMMTALDRELEFIDAERRWDLCATSEAPPENIDALTERPPTPAPAPVVRRRFASLATVLGAAAAVTAVIFGLAVHEWNWQEFGTTTGEQRAIELDDGSVVHLNTQSRLKVHFSADGREVRLLSGEALFKVHRDPARPFRVRTADALIQVLGTEFNVYHRPEGTMVSVLEGRVRVIGAPKESRTADTIAVTSLEPHDAKNPARSASLGAGQRARIDPAGQIATLQPDDQGSVTAWRQRRLIFKSTPLPQMVAEFNRYNRAPRFELRGPEAAERLFSGIFDADDPESLIELLEKEPGLAVQRNGDAVIIRGNWNVRGR